jgi:glycosyltransferase involved in cell wall biosynthesis
MTRPRILASAFTCCPSGTLGFSGGEDILGWNLLKQIARFHEVWVLTHGQDRVSIELALQREPVSNLNFHFVDLPKILRPFLRYQGGHQFYYYLWQLKAYAAARRLHRTWDFDLFHHITYANDWMVSFIGALLPIPYVRGPGGGAHRTPKGFEQEYSLPGRLWEKVRTLSQWLFRHDPLFIRGQSRAKAILVCNRESVAQIPAAWAHKIRIFPVNGISSEDLALTGRGHAADAGFRVLSAGSLIRVKGFGLAIKAFEEFARKVPDSEFKIIGSGPEESHLRSIVGRSRLQSKVLLLPAVARDELLARMASCDVFLFPSLRDGGGAVVIEAMAAGKPVVCLDVGGPGMHVTDECGIKVATHSPEDAAHQMADALERLHKDVTLRLKMGRAARKRAEQVYHWDRLGEKLMETYRYALAPVGND